MSRAHKIKNPEGVYFVTFIIIHWIDLFTRSAYCDLVLDSQYSSATAYAGRAVECPLEVVVLEVHGLEWNV